MNRKNPYEVIKSRYITEKSNVLETLKDNSSNQSISRFSSAKYVFLVDPRANKHEIKCAVEEIYSSKNIKVAYVNTLNQKPKRYNRRGKNNEGREREIKKAIVTLVAGDNLDE